ncbi:MAG: sensor histidine kinase [Lachnospiraceae bacterium]|nr:sensor histidine kinase [Lachnospiraceae bacterium]
MFLKSDWGLSRLKLAQKFGVTLFFILIIPIILVSVFVGNEIGATSFMEACNSRLALLTQTKENVDRFANDIQYVSLNILSNSKTQNLLKNYRDPDLTSAERQKLIVGFSVLELLESRDFIKSISLYDDEGIIYQYGLRVLGEDREYDEAVYFNKGRPLWTPAYIQSFPSMYYSRYVSGEYVVSLFRVVNDAYYFQKALGVERLTFEENYIASVYEGLKSPEGTMLLYNENGDIISSTNKEFLGLNIEEAIPGIFKDSKNIIASGGNMIFKSTMTSPDWTLVLQEPRTEFLAGQQQVATLTFMTILLIILFAIVFLMVQNKAVIRPVKELSKDAQNYKNGDFKISKYSDSADEIGQLNRSLIEMNRHIKDLIEREYKSKIAEREMELEYLNMQINPHFLYNTLDSIRWMAVLNNQTEIAKHLEAMSNLFRHTLNSGLKYTTVVEEIENLEAYLSLQQARFSDIMEYEISVDPKLRDCKIIKLLLQPIVENAVVHGLEPKQGEGKVTVCVDEFEGQLRLSVGDNGVGIDADSIWKYIKGDWSTKSSFALKNIHERLVLEYGEGHGLNIEGEKFKGTKIWFVVPILRGNYE